ncbi:rhamnosyltransferase [Thalassotalea insulae]|uniref:Rhamnosyltransferase n=1 Tax=Thalassotalea insulae TaxID=2056778 RepID=A0ABQ6GQW2_9GAMM|nr:DUF1972 domain-containing protein [Thalassotalea insulae]GLX77574.1 rhamnosyltransferase [Thalassotalea insulae]
MPKLSIVGTVGVPACYGGFETLVENLLDEKDDSYQISVYCSSKAYKATLKTYKNAKLHYIPLQANGIQSIPYDILSLLHATLKRSQNILLLGVSGALFLPLIRLFSKARIITNIDGLEWKRDKWGWFAQKFLKLSEKVAIKYSTTIIADNQAIADYVKLEYGADAKVIAYGGDHALLDSSDGKDDNYALALCRIEPENNVELILKAFRHSSKKLKFVGNWNSSEFGKRMSKRYCQYDNITLIDPIYDIRQLFELRNNCSFYIHGHSAGGTNPSLVEMMHFNKNILAFNCSYNRETTEHKAIYFANEDELLANIQKIDQHEKNCEMREIAQRRYTWNIVKKQYLELIT